MSSHRSILLLLSFLGLPVLSIAQTALVTQPIDESRQVALPASVHPLVHAAADLGKVPDSFATGCLILQLNRPPEREAALRQFLQDAHTRGSATYHQWLTPQQFGDRFGPSDADLETATGWLQAHGFAIQKVSKSRQFVEFSGTAAQLQEAFHTEIHQYSLHGQTQFANATGLSIPAALAPLIRGLSPLNSFIAKPNLELVGSASYARRTGKTTPGWTIKNGATTFYALAPEDFATQYDLAPLYQAGVTGSGQTIGIINESNIDLTLVQSYEKLFGLANPAPQIVIDGTDPGTVPGVAIEAYLDVEEAGATAPGATVNLYIGESSALLDPLYLAALRAVEDNQASVLSVSFGNCEGFLLQSGNTFWSNLWEQAAAQGQTVLVSSGDSDSAGCDDAGDQFRVAYGLAVNGLSSTPWNVSVGGTDFYYSDYATGGASAATLWNQTNDANNGSLKAPLPEQVWDTAFGLNAIGPFDENTANSVPGAGGGASSCINSAESTTQGSPLPFVCSPVSGSLYGYAKPAWQSGSGVPADGVRDLPDVALFASNGLNFSGYPICANPGDCVADSSGQTTVTIVGGTSAPTPAMAGILALVNQKYGRQGQADFTLYPLAHQVPSAFHDVTLGSNNVDCAPTSPNCSLDTDGDGLYSLQEYPAKAGYDQASGLGSVDAAVLVNHWNSISFQPTSTTLQINPTSATRGAAVSFTVNVKANSGAGVPQGSVSILTNAPTPASQSLGVLTISSDGTATGTLSNLPGGTYGVWAQYSGNGSFASSQSQPQSVTIAPGAGNLTLAGFDILNSSGSINPAAVCQPVISSSQALGGPNGQPYPNGSTFLPYFLPIAAVAVANGNVSALGAGTGNVTYTLNGTTMATLALNSLGYATWIPSPMLPAGNYTIGATYSGDANYSSATAAPFTFTVLQGTFEDFSAYPGAPCQSTASGSTCTLNAGDNLAVVVRLEAKSCIDPTGPVTVSLGSLSQSITLTPGGMGQDGERVLAGTAVFQNLPAGTYALSANYPGDANFQSINTSAFGSATTVVASTPPGALLSSATTVSANLSSLSSQPSAPLTYTVNVTGASGSAVPPTGTVLVFADGQVQGSAILSASGPNTSTASVSPLLPTFYTDFGMNQIIAIYAGDSVYRSSVSAASTLDYVYQSGPDFLFAPQLPQIAINSGSSATVGLNFQSLAGFNAAVVLSCAPSSTQITCSLNPGSVTVNGPATATLTLNVAAATSAVAPTAPLRSSRWPVVPASLALAFLLIGGRATRDFRKSLLLTFCLFAAMTTVSCGSSSTTITKTPPPPPPAFTTYSVLVTATAGGATHNAKITVVVPQ